MFDFLIDIVPREEILFKINKRQAATGNVTTKVGRHFDTHFISISARANLADHYKFAKV